MLLLSHKAQEEVKKGEYIVTYSYIGYAEISKNITISNNSQTLNLGELTLEEDANQLGEVEIVAKKPQMRFELDRKVFDATQDIASEGDRPVICLPISHPWKSITKDLFHCVEIPA